MKAWKVWALFYSAVAVIGGAGAGLSTLFGMGWIEGFIVGFVVACIWFVVDDLSGAWKGKNSS